MIARDLKIEAAGLLLCPPRTGYAIIVLAMDVFISWSGERSRAAAEALRGWLPKIINALKPWLSTADIDKGARWSTDVASRLEVAKAGIICLTPGNLHSEWILFEAGALSKTLKNTFVCPFLIGLEPSDVKAPLAQFQATRAVKKEVLKLLGTLNKALGESALEDDHIKEAFEVWWPRLESQLKDLPAEESASKPRRPDRELLEEILALVRSHSRPSDAPPNRLPLGQEPPYEIGGNAPIFEAINEVISAHGGTLSKILRVVPERPNTRRYQVELKQGPVFMLEIMNSPGQHVPTALAAQLETQLQNSATLNAEGSGPSDSFPT